jgi:hypothetical protein
MKRSTPLVTLVITLTVLTSACGQGASPTAPQPSAVPITHTAAPTRPVETQAPPPPTPTPLPIVVNSTEDSGPGSLRQALSEAQSGDTITFDPAVFQSEAPATIRLTSGLPELNQGNLTIDASNAGVVLDGSQITIPEFQNGLAVTSDHNTIRGLQIVGFTDAGIALYGGAQYNLIGGDRGIGTGPLGQGNLISSNGNFGIGLFEEGTSFNTIQGNTIGINLEGTATWGQARDGIHSNGANHNLITGNVIGGNENGVYLCCVADGRNKVTDNIIGTDPSGMISLGNRQAGVLIDRTHSNVIGPGNLIAHNDGQGILFWQDTADNMVTQNSIHDNGEQGINLGSNRIYRPAAPLIFDFDLVSGSLSGWACPDCTVEVFSDNNEEGAIYEGQATADSSGVFALDKDIAFAGPHLTATARDMSGNTSEFSTPVSGTSQLMTLQEDNNMPVTGIVPLRFKQLADNRIGDLFPLDRYPPPCPPAKYDWSFTHVGNLGLKWVRLSLDRLELDQARAMGDYSQFEINPCQDEMVTLFAENDITILYTIVYWDEKLHADRYPDYRNEEEVQRYLDYTRLIVHHFKGRIQYYEILNEALFYVKVADYINLIRRAVPVIREEDPQAKIVVGGSSNLLNLDYRNYLFSVLRSDVMPLVDGVALHPMYGPSPQYDDVRMYYYNYPSLIAEIKNVASEHGFTGEFIAEEMDWRTRLNPNPYEPWEYTSITAAKYYARGILINLGLGLRTGVAGENYDQIPAIVRVMQSLGATMGGVNADSLEVEIQSQATNIVSYAFSLPGGDMLLALWTDGAAVDDDPGVLAGLTFPGLSAGRVTGVDVLNGIEQELISESQGGNLIVRNLMVKDYPILLRLTAVVR